MKTLKEIWFDLTGREIDTDEKQAFKEWLQQKLKLAKKTDDYDIGKLFELLEELNQCP